ncbi:hypothetical protein ACQ4PT_020472 [Festuca glaucescens]
MGSSPPASDDDRYEGRTPAFSSLHRCFLRPTPNPRIHLLPSYAFPFPFFLPNKNKTTQTDDPSPPPPMVLLLTVTAARRRCCISGPPLLPPSEPRSVQTGNEGLCEGLPFNYFNLISEPTDLPISDDLWEQRTHARILVSDGEAGSIIGRGGSAVTALESTSGAHVKVSRRGQLLPGTDCRVLVSGLFHQVMDAAEIILQKILYQGGQVIDERATVVLVVPDACCGVLIGKGGTNIKSLAEASNAGIVISRHDKYYVLHDRLVTITGNLDNQLQAIFLILSELLEDDRYSRIYAGFSALILALDATTVFSAFFLLYVLPATQCALFLGCEDYGPDEHVERYHSRSNTPIRSPDNNDDARESLTIAIADEHIGAVIGCGGSKIREIIQFTGAWIRTSAKGEFIAGTTDREVVISGTREAINTAEGMIMHVVSAARSRSNGSAERPPLKPDTTPQQQEQSTTNDMQ